MVASANVYKMISRRSGSRKGKQIHLEDAERKGQKIFLLTKAY